MPGQRLSVLFKTDKDSQSEIHGHAGRKKSHRVSVLSLSSRSPLSFFSSLPSSSSAAFQHRFRRIEWTARPPARPESHIILRSPITRTHRSSYEQSLSWQKSFQSSKEEKQYRDSSNAQLRIFIRRDDSSRSLQVLVDPFRRRAGWMSTQRHFSPRSGRKTAKPFIVSPVLGLSSSVHSNPHEVLVSNSSSASFYSRPRCTLHQMM
ncbi:uncharacterized protein MYCGRDRAFT_106403, partial [Zymoseptoria tritici IPO323]